MKLRLKFGSRFEVIDVDEDSVLNALIEAAASAFNLISSNVLVSLNSTDFYASCDGRLKLQDVGIVSGDVIYVKSRVQSDDIKGARFTEAFSQLSDSIRDFHPPVENLGIGIALAPLDVSAKNKGLTDLCLVETTSNMVRAKYTYQSIGFAISTSIDFTIFSCGGFVSYAASVPNAPIQRQFPVKFDNYFVDPQKVDSDSRANINVIYKNPQDLIIQLSDCLIEPILVDIHEEFCLPPRLGLLSLPEAVLINIFAMLPVADLACVSISSRELNKFIGTCEPLWRRKLVHVYGILPFESSDFGPLETDSRMSFEKCSSFLTFRNVYRSKRPRKLRSRNF